MTARVSMLLKSRASPNMLPFILCNKKRLAIRHMNRPPLSNDTIDSVRHREVGRAKDLSEPPRTYIHIYIHTYIRTYIHSFVHSFIHSFTHSFIHSFIHSCKSESESCVGHTCFRSSTAISVWWTVYSKW
jgi:hypothetical protein